MTKITLSETLANGLIKMNCQEIPSTSKKYRMFRQSSQGRVFLVGKSGGLRVSNKGIVSDSMSCPDGFKDLVLRKGRGEA